MEIHKINYCCKSCKTIMNPTKRLAWRLSDGVRCLHHCKKCGSILIESEKGKNVFIK